MVTVRYKATWSGPTTTAAAVLGAGSGLVVGVAPHGGWWALPALAVLAAVVGVRGVLTP
jgi:hypothetical protein